MSDKKVLPWWAKPPIKGCFPSNRGWEFDRGNGTTVLIQGYPNLIERMKQEGYDLPIVVEAVKKPVVEEKPDYMFDTNSTTTPVEVEDKSEVVEEDSNKKGTKKKTKMITKIKGLFSE